MSRIILKRKGDPAEVAVTIEHAADDGAVVVHLDDRKRTVRLRGHDGRGTLDLDGTLLSYHVCSTDRGIEVWIDGRAVVLERVAQTAQRTDTTSHGPVAETVVAPMPGTVLRIVAQTGSKFEANDPLIIMESMKMEMTLSVPHPGQIGEVTCAAGDVVEAGAVLARLEDCDA
jgi:biotin carboxyl carrier protein